MTTLANRVCQPCKGGVMPLARPQIEELLAEIPNWQAVDNDRCIERVFKFKNYYQTIAFVNALAYLSHRQDHHADLEVGYNRCRVVFSTYAIGGLSENDFICAAQINERLASDSPQAG